MVATPLSSDSGQEQEPTLSPDGSHVAYVADPDGQLHYDLYVRSTGGGQPRRLTETEEVERSPAWSPDGRSIVFQRENGPDSAQILLAPALGGPERILATIPTSGGTFIQIAHLLAWHPTGKLIVYVEHRNGRSSLGILDLESGVRTPLPDPPPFSSDADPAVSPDGRQLAFVRSAVRGSQLIVAPLDAPAQSRAITSPERFASNPAWTADGREIIYAAGARHFRQLHRIASTGGEPTRLAVTGTFHTVWPALAAGRLVYHSGQFDVNLWRTPLSNRIAAGPAEKVATSNVIDHMGALSPDGQRLAFVSNRSGFLELWVGGPRGENALQLTNYRGREVLTAAWSPNGKRIGFAAGGDAFLLNLDGGSPVLALPNTGPFDWSPDGDFILLNDRSLGRIARLALKPGSKPEPISQKGGISPRPSPDGKWIYFARGTENASLWRVPATGGEESLFIEPVSNNGSWTVTKEGVWFLPPVDAAGRTSIQLKDHTAGGIKTVAPVSRRPMWGLTVCPDASCVIHSQADRFESDLMLVEQFR